MAYDEGLADRIRAAIEDEGGVSEKRMFGGLAFLVHGNMAVSASGQGGLLLRVDPRETDSVVREDGVTRFEMRGRPMGGWVRAIRARSPPSNRSPVGYGSVWPLRVRCRQSSRAGEVVTARLSPSGPRSRTDDGPVGNRGPRPWPRPP
jgi:TfoX N-terminal domain